MPSTRVVIIGAGQAGLAVSHLLTAASIDHQVLERGRTAERWRSQRWDSLRLLTPNWMSRLPGWSYRGPDPDGFMPADEVAGYLAGYAASFDAPVREGTAVLSVRWQGGRHGGRHSGRNSGRHGGRSSGRHGGRSSGPHGGRFLVDTDAGSWVADAVVIATGFCDEPAVPAVAAGLDPSIHQVTPDRYRNPSELPVGGVLVVSASATGVQIADELAADGRQVMLAVGRHSRLPRRYRGRDIMWWLDRLGVLDRPLDRDRVHRHPEPSLQIVGSGPDVRRHPREVDLPSLSGHGIRLGGRLVGLDGTRARFADDLGVTAAAADATLTRLLRRIDQHIAATGLELTSPAPGRFRRLVVDDATAPDRLDLRAAGIRCVVWATGYRRSYPWLHVPVLDAAGEIRHTAGVTAAPGLVVVGQRWQTRRSSTFLDGVGHDAAIVVDHLLSTVLSGMPAETVRNAS